MRCTALFGFALLAASCHTGGPPSVVNSEGPGHFEIRLHDPGAVDALVDAGHLTCSDCVLGFAEVAGEPALAIKSQEQFSDAIFDLEGLFGRPFDLTEGGYLSYRALIPEDSWISTINFNYQDAAGSNAGCGLPANSFVDHFGTWVDVLVDLQVQQQDSCSVWHGDTYPLAAVTSFSVNPYNANLLDTSVVYVNDLRLTQERPEGDFVAYRMADLDTVAQPFEIDFDDLAYLRRVTANRGYEATHHALDVGVYGNETRALRNRGDGSELNSFLIKLDQFTGHGADFTEAERFYFSYYLTEDSAPIDSTFLFVVSKDWEDILMDTSWDVEWQRGAWTQASFPIAGLDLELVRGEGPVLPNVHEIRWDFKHASDAEKIEMWIDDFGWE